MTRQNGCGQNDSRLNDCKQNDTRQIDCRLMRENE
jgi:hypothetical protein